MRIMLLSLFFCCFVLLRMAEYATKSGFQLLVEFYVWHVDRKLPAGTLLYEKQNLLHYIPTTAVKLQKLQKNCCFEAVVRELFLSPRVACNSTTAD